MKNPLLKSFIVAFLFWYSLIYVGGWWYELYSSSWELLLGDLKTVAMVLLVGLVAGGGLYWLSTFMFYSSVAAHLKGERLYGAAVSIGALPIVPTERATKKRNAMFAERAQWWSHYSDAHPKHAAVFEAVAELMAKEPKLPASPVPGGHGNATLIEHSWNVFDTMAEFVSEWKYTGHRNEKGAITYPLIDSNKSHHAFDVNDPLPPLVAFVHDIGKLICYQLKPSGEVEEVKPNHDIEGARLLRTLPETHGLPRADRDALLIAVGYYHHIGSLPESTWIDDRSRSLIELLIAADHETGRREQGKQAVDTAQSGQVEAATMPDRQDDPISAPAPIDDGEKELVELGALPIAQPSEIELAAVARSDEPEALELFSVIGDLLIEPERINGRREAQRIGFKYGQWVYIFDQPFRGALSDMLSDPSLLTPASRNAPHSFTAKVLEELSQRGQLLQTFEGASLPAAKSLFYLKSAKKEENAPVVFVIKTDAFPGVGRIKDCPREPGLIRPVWWTGKAEAPALHLPEKPLLDMTKLIEIVFYQTHPMQQMDFAEGAYTLIDREALEADYTIERSSLDQEVMFLTLENTNWLAVPSAAILGKNTRKKRQENAKQGEEPSSYQDAERTNAKHQQNEPAAPPDTEAQTAQRPQLDLEKLTQIITSEAYPQRHMDFAEGTYVLIERDVLEVDFSIERATLGESVVFLKMEDKNWLGMPKHAKGAESKNLTPEAVD